MTDYPNLQTLMRIRAKSRMDCAHAIGLNRTTFARRLRGGAAKKSGRGAGNGLPCEGPRPLRAKAVPATNPDAQPPRASPARPKRPPPDEAPPV